MTQFAPYLHTTPQSPPTLEGASTALNRTFELYLRPWFFKLELVFVIFSINTYGCPGLLYFYYPPPSSAACLLARVFPWRIVVPLRQRGSQHALDCGEGGGIAVTTRTMTMMTRNQTLASSPTALWWRCPRRLLGH